MLGIGFKVSDTPASAVERPLREFLEREYAPPPPNEGSSSSAELSAVQTQALEQFARLKSDVDLVRTPSSMSRLVLLRYYAQLERMTARFPHDIPRLQFTWNDSFCPRKKITQSSLFFEMAAVLFNYGALESQLGVQTDRSDADGLKTACRHFMLAAGAFATVSEQLVDKCVGARTPDMSAEGLGMLAQLMLAQAQACFYEKAIKDQMKDAVKAKLVHQALELYTSALELCNSPQLNGTIDRMWAVHIHFQVVCMKAATQYWQARAAKDAALSKGIGYGEEIARLQIADAECAEALKVGTQNKLPASLVQSARALQRVVQEQLQSARKDNASIYLENVPKASELPPVGKASLVKPLPLSPDEIAAELEGGVDLFDKFVPSALLRRAAEVKDQVQSMLTQASERVATGNEAAKAQLQSLGLPASIEAFEKTSDNGIPQSIWLKIAHVQSSVAGGDVVAATQQQLHANELASERAEKSLHSIETKLSHEEVEDNVCRQNYGATRWARPQSAALNDGFRLDIDRYFRLVKEAKESDKVVTTKLQANASLLALLAQRKPQLDAQLPPLQTDTSSCRDEIETLSRLLLQLSALLDEKDQVLQDFGASLAKFNVLPLLLRGGPSDAATDLALADEKKFFETHFVQKLEAVGADEAALLQEIQTANATFESKKAADQTMLARQAFLQQLSDAVDTSEQLQSHVKEGARFYEELHTRIAQLQQTVNDHCAARDLERREMELNVQADNDMREREARDAAVAAQMMRDLHLSGAPTPTNATTANDEALARQLAGATPQTFAGYTSFAPASSSSSSSAPPAPPQQQQPNYDFSRLQQQQPNRPPSTPYPQQQPSQPHPYAAYQQAQQPPPAYSSVFSSSPSSTPQFGNYYYAQQQQQQPQYPPQQPQYQPAYGQGGGAPPPQANAYYQYPPGASYARPPPRDSV